MRARVCIRMYVCVNVLLTVAPIVLPDFHFVDQEVKPRSKSYRRVVSVKGETEKMKRTERQRMTKRQTWRKKTNRTSEDSKVQDKMYLRKCMLTFLTTSPLHPSPLPPLVLAGGTLNGVSGLDNIRALEDNLCDLGVEVSLMPLTSFEAFARAIGAGSDITQPPASRQLDTAAGIHCYILEYSPRSRRFLIIICIPLVAVLI